jgi:DNA-binding IclR family transcriptional regulator
LTRKTLVRRDAFQAQIVDIRRRGFASTVDELEDGFAAVATVIRGPLGDVQGALSIGGPTQRMDASKRAALGAALCHAAQRLSPRF